MAVREVKKKAAAEVMRCGSCGLTQIRIGTPKDWMPWGGSYVCGKDACRERMSAPRFVPPDERKV